MIILFMLNLIMVTNLSAMGDTYIWYRLAEPTVTYQLTPQQLTTLRGINNIWSSANGEVEIKYWKH